MANNPFQYLDPAFAPRPEYTPYPDGLPDEFYQAQMAKYAAQTGTLPWWQQAAQKEAAYKNQLLSGTPNYAGSAPNVAPDYAAHNANLPPVRAGDQYGPFAPAGPYGTGNMASPFNNQPGFNPVTGPADPTQPPQPATGAAPAGPFAPLMAQMNPSGFARPEASQWLQQAMSQPYMAGWGPPAKPGAGAMPGWGNAPGGPGGGITNAPGVVTPGKLLGSQLEISPEAKKLAKKFKKMRSASHMGWDDALKVAGSVALGVATGGSTLAGQIAGGALAGGGALFGANAENKALGGSVKDFRKIKNKALTEAMADTGWTRKNGKGKWLDAAGNDLTMPQIMQQLLNMGVIGG